MLVDTCKERCRQHIRVVDFQEQGWNVAYAQGMICYLLSGKIVKDEAANASRKRQIGIIGKQLVRINKAVADERRPHHCGNALRQIMAARLIVEGPSPGMAPLPPPLTLFN